MCRVPSCVCVCVLRRLTLFRKLTLPVGLFEVVVKGNTDVCACVHGYRFCVCFAISVYCPFLTVSVFLLNYTIRHMNT